MSRQGLLELGHHVELRCRSRSVTRNPAALKAVGERFAEISSLSHPLDPTPQDKEMAAAAGRSPDRRSESRQRALHVYGPTRAPRSDQRALDHLATATRTDKHGEPRIVSRPDKVDSARAQVIREILDYCGSKRWPDKQPPPPACQVPNQVAHISARRSSTARLPRPTHRCIVGQGSLDDSVK